MIGATAAALQGQPVWQFLVWGLPSALVVASLWTRFMMAATPAELHFRAGQAAIQSIHDVLENRSPSWAPLYNVRVTPGSTEISFGWDTIIVRRRNWPNYNDLRDAAQQALRSQRVSSVASPTSHE